jgi:hypothetical protein
LPSIIPSYVYTLFASAIVGTLIISMCGLSVANVKREAEEQQLLSITGYVVVKSMKLASYAPSENVTSTVRLNVPALIGNQRYWIRFQNDSSKAWVEAGFSTASSSGKRVLIPLEVAASGTCISDSNAAFIEYYSDSAGAHLILYGGS